MISYGNKASGITEKLYLNLYVEIRTKKILREREEEQQWSKWEEQENYLHKFTYEELCEKYEEMFDHLMEMATKFVTDCKWL